jgi:hypothetical protein
MIFRLDQVHLATAINFALQTTTANGSANHQSITAVGSSTAAQLLTIHAPVAPQVVSTAKKKLVNRLDSFEDNTCIMRFIYLYFY